MTTGFRTTTVVRETLRNALSYRLLVAVQVVVAFAVGAVVAGWSLQDTAARQNTWVKWVEGGGLVYSVTSRSSDATLSAANCDALRNSTQVTAAGAVVDSTQVIAANQPTATYPIDWVTPGYLPLMWPNQPFADQRLDGVYVGKQVAENLGLQPGSTLKVTSAADGAASTLTVIDVLPTSPRNDGLDRRIFATTNSNATVNQCYAEIGQGHRSHALTVLLGELPAQTDPLATTSRGRSPMPETDLRERVSAYAWAGGLLAVAVIAGLVWFVRRGDFALLQLLGLGRAKLLLAASVETIVLTVVPLLAGVLAAIVVQADNATGLAASIALNDVTRLLLGIALVPLLAALIARPRRIVDRLKGS